MDVKELREHEKTDLKRLETVKQEIESDGVVKLAIIADEATKVVLDGEHRLTALRELGYTKAPVIFVDYESSDISVESWKIGEQLTKDTVILAGLTRKKLPPKTSRHMVKLGDKYEHISVLGGRMDVPLEKLK